jgi:hypothetical protein
MTSPTCDCCSGFAVATPQSIGNRAGLSTVGYRVGRHGDFLASMIARLTDASRPALAALTTRDRDDFTIALLDSWAAVADVLAFYNERLVNESYLRTALDRTSLQELGKLIGYQLDPGAAAETHLAFALEHPPIAPATQSKEPGLTPAIVPSIVELERGLRVQSIPGPGEQPQTFETVEDSQARPEWNALSATTTMPWRSELNVTSAWLDGVGLNLKPGDMFLLAGSDIIGERWDARLLTEVVADAQADRTEVRWTPGLGSTSPLIHPASTPTAHVFRKRAGIFGANAPLWRSMTLQFRVDYSGDPPLPGEWPDFEISNASGNTVDLDGAHPDIVVGSWALLSRPNYRELWKVDGSSELARAEFGISGKVTRLELVDGENYGIFDDEVRETTVYAVSEELTLVDQPDFSPVGSSSVQVDADASAMEAGRTVIVTGTTTAGDTASEVAEVESITADGVRWTIHLAENLANTYVRSTVVVYGNVSLATHGESVSEILGSGRAAQGFQRFLLTRPNLTFAQSSDPAGAATTLTVRVNGVAWTQADTLYAAEPNDQKYSVRLNEQGKRVVRFGDGVKGSRLATGNQNVIAEYRHGIGTAGNVGAHSLAQLVDRPLGAKGVSNPIGADGGVDPENEQAARATMPLKVRTLGRAVSLVDYADFSRASTGVSKAHAAVLPLRGVRTIVVTVAFSPGTVTDATARAADLETALKTFGDPQVAVRVVSYHQRTFRLALRVGVDDRYDVDTVLESVRAKIGAAFDFEHRGLTEPLHRSEVIEVAHQVKGVAAVDIDLLYRGPIAHLATRVLPQLPGVTSAGEPMAAGLLVIDDDPFDVLGVLT